MERARFQEYIDRFNAEDATAFDDFLEPDVVVVNGTLELPGVQGMKDHYARIWGSFREVLDVGRYVTDGESIAIEMKTAFLALRDDPDSTFGPVLAGERFDFDGLILYTLRGGRFATIRVAYNSFAFTGLDGVRRELGIPH